MATKDQTWDDQLRRRIAARAHELYLARGKQKGYDMQDWLQAEKELSKAKTTTESMNTSQSLDVASDLVQPRLRSPLKTAVGI